MIDPYKYGNSPRVEYELDADMKRTGRTRKRQFICYPRPWDVKPIKPWRFA